MPADPSNLTRQPDKSNTVAHTPEEDALAVAEVAFQQTRAHETGETILHIGGANQRALRAAIAAYLAAADRLHSEGTSVLNELKWCVENDGECLGDHPQRLAAARQAILRAQGAEQ